MTNTALNLAIKKAGGRVPLSKALGIERQAIYNWEQQGWVPAPRALEIERKFGVKAISLIKPALRAVVTSLAPTR